MSYRLFGHPADMEMQNENSQSEDWLFFLLLLARPERFERPTPWFVEKFLPFFMGFYWIFWDVVGQS